MSGEIELRAEIVKTKHGRTIDLAVSPALRELLAVLEKQTKATSRYVFGGREPMPRTQAEAARKRLLATYNAPTFTWQMLRRTTGTYLTNSPSIFGAASVFMSARQLGHAVQVAEKCYLGRVRGISPTARTLEAAMGIEEQMARVIEAARKRSR